MFAVHNLDQIELPPDDTVNRAVKQKVLLILSNPLLLAFCNAYRHWMPRLSWAPLVTSNNPQAEVCDMTLGLSTSLQATQI